MIRFILIFFTQYQKNKIGNKFIKTQNIKKAELTLKKQYVRIQNIQIDYFKKTAIAIARTKKGKKC